MHALRAQFPVLERLAYLNAGTNGPVPARAVEAVEASVRRQAEEGRAGKAFFEECVAARRRPARAGRGAARRRHRRAHAHRLDHRRRERGAERPRPAPRRRDPHLATRSTPACSPRSRGRGTRTGSRIRMAPFAELATRSAPARASWPAPTCPGQRAGWWTRRRSRRAARSCCWTAPKGSAHCPWTCARSAATTTRPPARSGSAGRTASATSTCAPASRGAARPLARLPLATRAR